MSYSEYQPQPKTNLKWLWWLLGCGFLAALLVCGGLIAAGVAGFKTASKRTPWPTLGVMGKDFTAMFPGPTGSQKTKVGSGLAAADVVTVACELPNGTRCLVQVAEFADLVAMAQPEQFLDSYIDSWVAGVGGTKPRRFPTSLSGFTGREVRADIKDGRALRMRIYSVHNRLYTIAVIGLPPDPDGLGALGFLGSLRVNPPPGIPH
jgi:hypothetical protein